MSISPIYPKEFNIQDYELFPIGSSHNLVLKGTTSNSICPKFIINSTIVKYLPLKFNKITIQLDNETMTYMKVIDDQFKADIQTESFIKDNTMSLKLSSDVKELTKSLKVGDNVRIVVEFNNVWKMAGKQYASWKLLQFKKVIVKEENYFTD